MRYTLNWATCDRCKVAIKQVAGEEVVVMREDFRESYSTYPGDLNVPLGRSEQIMYGGVGCSIRFDVNYRHYHTSAGYTCVLLLQASLSSKPPISRLYRLSILEHIHYFIID